MLLIRAMLHLFSFGASLNRTLSPHENICTIALITIHYLYIIEHSSQSQIHCFVCLSTETTSYTSATSGQPSV